MDDGNMEVMTPESDYQCVVQNTCVREHWTGGAAITNCTDAELLKLQIMLGYHPLCFTDACSLRNSPFPNVYSYFCNSLSYFLIV